MSSKTEVCMPLRRRPDSTQLKIPSTRFQCYSFIPHDYKDVHLIHLLNERVGQMAIIFARTVQETERLSNVLRMLEFPAIAIHGKLSQSTCLESLNKFRARFRNLLIVTDLGARELDIPLVDLVVNYDLPQD
ncbi:hypothetical protein PHISCL_06465 [Aspergillus sclerotialis]|uniref:RNA helicase n=1 Tax=Aspergillus sclerotialis TaxID=2070753 RepID=A0A3A2ZDG8_9EURO|nr:hypothetical protein PHISCL_06465 [Aspergillus sclerotialis]